MTLVLAVSTSASDLTYQTNSAVAAGLAAAALAACFGPVSGAHANPAVTSAMVIVRALSPLRAVLYVCAQCGGAIGGAALVLGVLVSLKFTCQMRFLLSNLSPQEQFVLFFVHIRSS